MMRLRNVVVWPKRKQNHAALTLVELAVTVAILSILVLAAVPNLLRFQTRAKVSASKNNLRVLVNALETYHLDHGTYPPPIVSPDDPFGIVSLQSLKVLTTPVAYAGPDAFHDPFGSLKIQVPATGSFLRLSDDPFRPPTPGFNTDQCLLYFHYPDLAELFALTMPDACAVVSVGPDLKDSFVVYYPFPHCLPTRAAHYGIHSVLDSVYDPTNGTISGGDLAAFGGCLCVPRFVGGGN